MKVNQLPRAALIGRTIRDHIGNWWSVVGLQDQHVQLFANGKSGLLRYVMLDRCKLYPSHEEAEKRYPLLLRALRWGAILTPSEASGVIVGHVVNGPFSAQSEAVAHIGGSAAAIRQAIRCRHVVRKLHSHDNLKSAA